MLPDAENIVYMAAGLLLAAVLSNVLRKSTPATGAIFEPEPSTETDPVSVGDSKTPVHDPGDEPVTSTGACRSPLPISTAASATQTPSAAQCHQTTQTQPADTSEESAQGPILQSLPPPLAITPPAQVPSQYSHPDTAAAAATASAAGGLNSYSSLEDTVRMLSRQVETLELEIERRKHQTGKIEAENIQLRDRLAEQARIQLTRGPSRFEDLSLGENRPTKLILRYSEINLESRSDAWDALDLIPELDEIEDCREKLLFSIVVLSFRQADMSLKDRLNVIRDTLLTSKPRTGEGHGTAGGRQGRNGSLHNDPQSGAAVGGVEAENHDDQLLLQNIEDLALHYFRRTISGYDVSQDFHAVTNQLWTQLIDYPSLRTCQNLLRYTRDCLKAAWALTVQNPPYVIAYDDNVFSDDVHTRFHTSDPGSNRIKSFLWPALIEKTTGYCVSKAIVVT